MEISVRDETLAGALVDSLVPSRDDDHLIQTGESVHHLLGQALALRIHQDDGRFASRHLRPSHDEPPQWQPQVGLP